MVDDFNSGQTVKISPLNCFTRGINSFGFNEAIQALPMKENIESITVPISRHQDYIGNRDIDNKFHKGFTVGRGKVMYWMLIWHNTGTATVYPIDENRWPRNLKGDELITIHFN